MENITEKFRYDIWLSIAMQSAGSNKYWELIESFDDNAFEVFLAARSKSLHKVGRIRKSTLDEVCKCANEGFIDRCLERLDKLKISIAPALSNEYPRALREIYAPPSMLYYKGKPINDIALPIAVIGSRMPSEYGRRVARELSEQLAQGGACVVSGLAYGVDSLAATGALNVAESKFPTIAVLGSGVDVIYPESNREVYEKIVEHGAVISEFLPGTRPERRNFPQRNRIISGISRGVVVVEAADKSGTLITVDCALDQGRDVFAVPGRITEPKSMGTNILIRDGMAKMVLSADDVLSEYGITSKKIDSANTQAYEKLEYEQALICKLLEAGERSFDALCELTGLSPQILNSSLTELELSGIIKQSSGRVFSLYF